MDTTIPAVRTDFTTMNRSDGAPPNVCNVQTLTPSLLIIIISLCGLVGNAIVLWFLCFCLQRNIFSVYLVNLAVADFLFLCCQVLFSLEELIDIFHSVFIAIPYFFSTVFCFFYIASLSILSIISTERCLSILCPVWFRCHRPRHTSATMCALLWVLSLLLSTLEGNYCGFLFEDFEHNWCQTFDFITTAWLIFLFLVLAGCSLVLLNRILYSFQRLQLTRLYVTIVLTVLVFLVCGLPFGIHWFLLIWIHKNVFTCYLDWVGLILCSVNSSVNPIIYFFVGSFRQRGQLRQRRRLPLTLRIVLQRALQDTPELDESAGSFTQEMSRNSVM